MIPVFTITPRLVDRRHDDDDPAPPGADLCPLASPQSRRAARQTDTRDRVIPSTRVVANR